MRRRVIVVLAVVSLGLVAALLVSQRADPRRVRARLQRGLTKVVGPPVHVAHASVDLGRRLQATDLELGSPSKTPFWIRLASLTAQLGHADLVREDVDLEEMVLQGVQIWFDPDRLTAAAPAVPRGAGAASGDRVARIRWVDPLWMSIGSSATTPTVTLKWPPGQIDTQILLNPPTHGRWSIPSGLKLIPGLATSAPIDVVSGSLSLDKRKVAAEEVKLRLGRSLATVSGRADGTTRTWTVDLGSATLDLADARRLVALPGVTGQVKVQGRMHSTPTTTELALEVSPATVDWIPESAPALRWTTGPVLVTREGDRLLVTASDPKHPVGLRMGSADTAQELTVASGDVMVRGTTIDLVGLDVQGRTSPSGDGPADPRTPPRARIHGSITGVGGLAPFPPSVDVSVITSVCDLGRLVGLPSDRVGARGALFLTVRGTVGASLASGHVALSAAFFSWGSRSGSDPTSRRLELTAPGTLRLDGPRWTLEPVPGRSGAVDSTVSGTAFVKDGLQSWSLRAKADGAAADKVAALADVSLAPWNASGRLREVVVDVQGGKGAADPTWTAAVDLTGLTGRWPSDRGETVPWTVTGGRLGIAGNRLEFADVKVAVAGPRLGESQLTLSGVLDRAAALKEPGTAGRLRVHSSNLDGRLLQTTLPPGVGTFSGRSELDITVLPTRGRTRPRGTLDLAGLTWALPQLNKPVRIVAGTLELEETKGQLLGVEVQLGEDRVRVAGTVGLTPGSPIHLRVAGPFELGHLTASAGKATAHGRAFVDLEVAGPSSALVLTGTVKAPRLDIATEAAKVSVTDVVFDVDADEDGLDLPRVSLVYQGTRLGGAVAPDGSFKIDVKDLDLTKLTGPDRTGAMIQSGRVTVSATGLMAEDSTMRVKGTVTVNELVLDMSSSKKLQQLKSRADTGETGSALATGLLGATGLGFLAGASAAQAHFFSEVLDAAIGVHSMGTISSPMELKDGRLELSDISGKMVAGNAAWQLAPPQTLKGTLKFVQLGEARFENVVLGGTLADPEPQVALTDVRLGGRTAPGKGGQGSINLKTLAKPGVIAVVGWPLAVADLLIPRLFGKKKRRRPQPTPSPSIEPAPTPGASIRQ